MGRKSLPPNQRAQPISFSLKPHLIEKIDDYANDLRFSRSKFLMEAVTQYMLKYDMGYMASSNNVNDMTLAQKVAVGLAALQEANREGETISKPVMDALRRELKINKDIEDEERLDNFMETFGNKKPELTFEKVRAGEHNVYLDSHLHATIEKDPHVKTFPWMVLTEMYRAPPNFGLPDLESKSFQTYHEAVRYVKYYWG